MSQDDQRNESEFDAYQRGFAAGQAAVNEDTDLLDFLEAHKRPDSLWIVEVGGGVEIATLTRYPGDLGTYCATLREAIRKAMEREAKT